MAVDISLFGLLCCQSQVEFFEMIYDTVLSSVWVSVLFKFIVNVELERYKRFAIIGTSLNKMCTMCVWNNKFWLCFGPYTTVFHCSYWFYIIYVSSKMALYVKQVTQIKISLGPFEVEMLSNSKFLTG